ncbi:MAG TPA: hypothetical protein VGH20_08670 [Myxococcales bacterium]|jgi:hypothetical protein
MSGRVRTIEHGIVLQDFSRIAHAQEALAAIAEARAFMQARPPNRSTLLLTDFTGSIYNQEVTDAVRRLAKDYQPYVRASAVYGVTPIMRVILRAVIALTGRDIRLFATHEEAVAYLAAFNDPASEARVSPQKP